MTRPRGESTRTPTRTVLRISNSPEETRAIAASLGRAVDVDVAPPRGGVAFMVALLGDLGAGKTVFAAGLIEGLGAPRGTTVTSPTFTFAKGYRGRAPAHIPIHHVDAYMIRGRGDLEASGFFELGSAEAAGGTGGVIAVEWADRIADSLPADRLEVELTVPPEPAPDAPSAEEPTHTRRIEIRALGPVSESVLRRFLERGPS